MSSNGCTTCDPRIFSRPVRMVLPPMLAQSSPSRYQRVRPSTVVWTGTRSFNDSGAREVQRSAGSVKWASQSMIEMPFSGSVAAAIVFRALGECHS